MGAVTGLLGVGGGAGGTSFDVQTPVSTQQAGQAYTGVQNSLTSQQQLLGALQGQNGIGNQAQNYNQLQGVVNGTGPNPAQSMLNQATGANVANQAALMAGQRGASSNVGLMARQAAQQGAQTQQQAVGQGATLQAQQSLNALGQAGSLATQQAGQQIGQTNANVGSQQSEQQNLLNSIAGTNNVNGQLASTQMQGQQGLIGGALSGFGLTSSLAQGGMVKGYADGGDIYSSNTSPASTPPQTPTFGSDPAAQALSGKSSSGGGGGVAALLSSGGITSGPRSAIGKMLCNGGMKNGGMVDVMLSPGEIKLNPKEIGEVKKGADPMKVGTTVPGQASVGGAINSYSNDTYKDRVPKGTIIVPRSETKSQNPDQNSRQFVDETLAKRGVNKASGGRVYAAGGADTSSIPDFLKADDSIPSALSTNAPDPTALPPSFIPGPQASDPSTYDQAVQTKGQMAEAFPGENSKSASDTANPDQADRVVADWDPKQGLGIHEVAGQAPNDMQTTPAGEVASNGNDLTGVTPQGEAPDVGGQPQQAPQAPATPEQHYVAKKQQLMQEDQHIQHDLSTGQIKPETMHDLFAKKDTLGKIGTIFGLMMSSMGAGLSHQPNALLQMMNSQIQNDLDAQTKNQATGLEKQRIGQQGALNQATIGHLNSETALQNMTVKNMAMNRAALHSLVQQSEKLPIGSPQRVQAEQTLAALSQAVNSENYNLADKASANMARMKMMMGDSNGQDMANQDPSKQIRQKQIMGFITPEQSKEALKETGAVQNHVALNKNALDSFDKVAALTTLASKATNPIQNQKRIDAEWNPMMDKLTKDTEGRVTPITIDMMGALKPALTDNRDTSILKRQKLNGILNAGFATPTLDSIGVRVNKGESGQQTQQAGNQNEVRYDSQGNAYRKGPDGRAVRVNQTAAR